MILVVVRGNKILERIVNPRGKIERGSPGDDTRLVDITDQPWLKVGDYWGPDPAKWVKNPTPAPVDPGVAGG
jgi:hypothetical protein